MANFDETAVYDGSDFYNCIGEMKQWFYESLFEEGAKKADKTDEEVGALFDKTTYFIECLNGLYREYDKLMEDNKHLRTLLLETYHKDAANENEKSNGKKK